MATIVDYMNAAVTLAQFVELKDGSVYGEIAAFPGVECTGKTVDDCKRQLRQMVREWVAGVQRSGELVPVINGVDINN